MARKLHHLTVRRGVRVLASGQIDVDPDDGYDLSQAVAALLKQAQRSDKPDGLTVGVESADRRKWIKEVTLR